MPAAYLIADVSISDAERMAHYREWSTKAIREHGAEVLAFARPHELEIVPDAQRSDGVAARISRILSFGVTARIELEGSNGASGRHFEVELTREQVTELALYEGQAVRLVPSRLKVFAKPADAPAGARR
jgi:sulfate transport system ATP-binding protein